MPIKATVFPFTDVNGEGTIHHDGFGAFALIGICAAAKRMGKKVAVVNCSIMALDELLLDTLRQSVDYFSVREPLTFRYLQTNDIAATQSADCLFLASECSEGSGTSNLVAIGDAPYVIYTPGVLSAFGQINESSITSDIRAIRDLGRNVVYYVVETEDERLASVAARAGASILPLGAARWRQVQRLLAGAEWVVSGRYHINIFASLVGTPFVPMETNTSKMNGLLELLGHHDPKGIRNWNSVGTEAGTPSPIGPAGAIKVPAKAVLECVSLAKNSICLTTRSELA